MRKRRRSASATVILGAAILAVCAGMVLLTANRLGSVELHPSGTEIVYDDFGFTATEAHASARIGGLAPAADRWFYIVRVVATNHAKRVDYDFHPQMARLYAMDGSRIRNSDQGQAALDAKLPFPQMGSISLSPRGDSSTRLLVFEGAAGLDEVRIAFSSPDSVGGVLDSLLVGNQSVLLHVSRESAFSAAGLK